MHLWLVVSLFIAAWSLPGPAFAQQRQQPKTYLLPILRYGPSNQKRDLRQLAALAKQLDAGLVLTGLFRHYMDIQALDEQQRDPNPAPAGTTPKRRLLHEFTPTHSLTSPALSIPVSLQQHKLHRVDLPTTHSQPTGCQHADTDTATQAGSLRRRARALQEPQRQPGTWSSAVVSADTNALGATAAAHRQQQRELRQTGQQGREGSVQQGRGAQVQAAGSQQHGSVSSVSSVDGSIGDVQLSNGNGWGVWLSHAVRRVQEIIWPPLQPTDGSDSVELTPTTQPTDTQTDSATQPAQPAPQPAGTTHTDSATAGRAIVDVLASSFGGDMGLIETHDAEDPEPPPPPLQPPSPSPQPPAAPQAPQVAAVAAPSTQTQSQGGSSEQRSCFYNTFPHYMDFESVMDRSQLSDLVPVATAAELKAQGWSGEIDAMLYRENGGPLDVKSMQHALDKVLGATDTVIAGNWTEILVRPPLWCGPNVLAELKKTVSQFRVIAVISFAISKSEYPEWGQLIGAEPKQPCPRALWQANRALTSAPWIRSVASRYVREYIGTEPFLAVHVRPYPDKCLNAWKRDQLNDRDLRGICHKQLQLVLAKEVFALTQQAFSELPKVFIMAHPDVRHHIQTLLSEVNITPLFLTEEILLRMAGCNDNSASFMAMVEEQVAVQAHAFLGTSVSAITHNIAVERLAAGKGLMRFLDSNARTPDLRVG